MPALDPAGLDRRAANALLTALVQPRPIAWVSTLAPDGTRNLAPFSFFNVFSFHPHPTLAVAPGARRGVEKDTLRNVRASGELTVSVVTDALAERANRSSADLGPDVDEWDVADVRGARSDLVAPDWVAESPAAFECRVLTIVDLGDDATRSNALVVARIVRIHAPDDRAAPLDLVGRGAGDEWVRTTDRFDLPRPRGTDPATLDAPERREVDPAR